jgi:Macrocin-O-methyltransferase (TylF)
MTDLKQAHWDTDVPVPLKWMRQFRYFASLFEKISALQGDVVECGVGKGNTFLMLCYLAGASSIQRTVRGFDSFAGFPQPSVHDVSYRNPRAGEWCVPETLVRERLKTAGVHDAYPQLQVCITPGFLGETLPKEAHAPYEIAFLHLDVDIYDSYRDGLQYLFPKVVPGGIVAFDEYREFSPKRPTEEKWPGCTKAVDEYLAPLGYTPVYHPETRKYFVMKR